MVAGLGQEDCPGLDVYFQRMSSSVLDFHALVQALEEHPEWRAELRRLILSEELFSLPPAVKRLEEEMARLVATVERLAENQAQMEVAIRELGEAQRRLVEAQARTEKRVEELAEAHQRLAEAQARTESALEQLTKRVDALAGQVGELRGQFLEMSFREKAPAYLGRYLRKVRVWPSFRVAELLDEAVDAGRVNSEEREAVLLADAVVEGVSFEGEALSVVVEVSSVVDERDVARAVERAEVLAKALGRRVQAAVAGHEIPGPVRRLAERLGVWGLEDGRRVAAAS